MTDKGPLLRKEKEGVYRIYRGGEKTPWTVERNDNELAPGGNRAIAWQLIRDERSDPTYEGGSRRACVDHWVRVYGRSVS